jgi:glucan biosynthesis protein
MCRLALLLALMASFAALPARAFDLDDVAAKASVLAQHPYEDSQKKVPDWMLVGALTYDQWRDIRFRPDHALRRLAGHAGDAAVEAQGVPGDGDYADLVLLEHAEVHGQLSQGDVR